jgi:hypothetical protein
MLPWVISFFILFRFTRPVSILDTRQTGPTKNPTAQQKAGIAPQCIIIAVPVQRAPQNNAV